VSQAERDEVDLFFHTRDGAPAELHQRLLFSERYVLAGRAGHPALRAPLSLAQFCQLDQVIVSRTAAVSCRNRYCAGQPWAFAAGCPFGATFPVYAGDAAQ
jgi:DNA-binding transcriptional LysR family regulator